MLIVARVFQIEAKDKSCAERAAKATALLERATAKAEKARLLTSRYDSDQTESAQGRDTNEAQEKSLRQGDEMNEGEEKGDGKDKDDVNDNNGDNDEGDDEDEDGDEAGEDEAAKVLGGSDNEEEP